MAGSNNDINMLLHSPRFDMLAEGNSPDVQFVVNSHRYEKGYYLDHGIYPS
jgi:hypothetical protein